MLKLQDICVSLEDSERPVLYKLNLEVATGEFVVIIGGNGTGKSTMFNVISGYITANQGKVIIDNQDITKLSQQSRAPFVAKVMQDPRMGTMGNMTIEENMCLAYMRGKNRGFTTYSTTKRRRLFREKLALLSMGLENRLEDLVNTLSGGQRQALALIMSIITDSKVLLLDEITAALDPKAAENVMQITARVVKEEKRTTIMITHDMEHAIRYGERTLLLSEGKITKEFKASEKNTLTSSTLKNEF